MNSRSRQAGIGIVSLGCAKNLVDTEVFMKQLDADRFPIVLNPSENERIDTVVINTCGFILDAKSESIDTILRFARAKQSGRIRHLFVMGCLSQRYREQLERELPEVDAFFGVHELKKIVERVGGRYRKELTGERLLATPSHYAYLKIAEGCDRKCSFCSIPFIRGKHVSRPLCSLLAEAENLAASGVRELNIISQDTTWYGLDRYRERKLPELMRKLAGIRELEWIRLHYTYPDGFPEDLLDVIRDHPTICKYIDIPLQHISPFILRSMRRGLGTTATLRLLSTIRKKIPGVAVRSTLMVGYPGETARMFRELTEFVREACFERLGIFTYSHEDGTPAGTLRDSVPVRVKRERAGELMELQQGISLQLNRRKIGSILKVIIDSREGDHWIGRTEHDSPEVDNEVIIPGKNLPLSPGNFYSVRIREAYEFDLAGELAMT